MIIYSRILIFTKKKKQLVIFYGQKYENSKGQGNK